MHDIDGEEHWSFQESSRGNQPNKLRNVNIDKSPIPQPRPCSPNLLNLSIILPLDLRLLKRIQLFDLCQFHDPTTPIKPIKAQHLSPKQASKQPD